MNPLRPEHELRLLLHRLGRGHLETRADDEEPNLGYKPRYKEGYFPVPPHDSQQDLRSEMVMNLIDAGGSGSRPITMR